MVIQNIVFPSSDFNPILNAFIRVKGNSNLKVDIDELILGKKSRADFNTYFNGFSVEKWKKYTEIESVKLHLEIIGTFDLFIYNEYRSQNVNKKQEINRYTISSSEPSTTLFRSNFQSSDPAVDENDEVLNDEKITGFDIEIPDFIERGMVSFSLISQEDNSVLKSGYFYTYDCLDEFNNVCFAVDICTYKREKFVTKNIQMLKESVFNENSPLRDAFEIFISDNGNSLVLDTDCEKIHVFPNKNAGGAGGFGRSMIEILQSPNYDKFTHIIMMDDDIKFSYETLYRTYIMAAKLKKEYRNAFIGGAMINLNEPKIQSEAMDLWTVTGNIPIKYNYDITNLKYVLKNEIEDKVNHLGWWYCAMPIGVVKANNLPLPVFIKRDDIEYGIRNGSNFITLNGICVMHEAFNLKRQGYLEYYYWRNQCILNSIHYPKYDKELLKQQMRGVTKTGILTYRYNDVNLAFLGVQDFLKGIDWLKTTDAEDLNSYVINYTYKPVDIASLPFNFIHGQYEVSMSSEAGIKKKVTPKNAKYLNKKLFLGLFLTASGTRYVKMNKPAGYMFYRKKTIVNYDEVSNKAFITKKSLKQTFNVYINYKRLCKLIDKKYDQIKDEYKLRYRELTNLSFWRSYLGLDGTVFPKRDFSEESIVISENDIAKKKHYKSVIKRDRKFITKVRLARFVQHCFLFWWPIKRNRISFYLYERKGYTCNIKYIIEELRKRYGNSCEIVFITRYPESFVNLKNDGIKVVRLNKIQHFYYQFTSKVVVTNDSYPESVVLRRQQYKINTWHACMNYKKIGPAYSHFRNDIARELFSIRNKQPNLYLSGSQFFTDNTSASFNFSEKIFLPTGSPRNDIFFRNNTSLNEKIRMRYVLDSKCNLALYAPTFRDGFREDLYGIDFERLTSSLTKRFGGEWKILYRKHYFVNSKDAILDKNTIDVSDYDDMNELLAISDVLISDYSSCLWDFALTKRPSFIYAPDLQEYDKNDRSFAYPLEKWPYTIAIDNDELEQNILAFDETNYQKKVTAHQTDAVCFDDGHASEKVVDIIAQKMHLEQN